METAATIAFEKRRQRFALEIGRKFIALPRLVFERIVLRIGFQEKVKRIDHRHLGHEIHFDAEIPRGLQENQAREIIRLRVLLPINEMLGR